jgi:hypothetical protein
MALREATMFLNRRLAAGVCVLTAGLAAGSGASRAAETPVTCTNIASGTAWQINVDYDKSTVNANPAKISAAEISWHSAKDNRNYSLDRKSGALTEIVPSSTGGYFVDHRCALTK